MTFSITGPSIRPVHKYAIGGVFEHDGGNCFYKIVGHYADGYAILTGEKTLELAYARDDKSRLADDGKTPFTTIARFKYYPPKDYKQEPLKETEYIEL